MTKIKAMSIEKITSQVAYITRIKPNDMPQVFYEELELIRAWTEAEARARIAEFQNLHQSPGLCEREECLFGNSDSTHEGWEWMFSDWLNSVLDEIGFPHE